MRQRLVEADGVEELGINELLPAFGIRQATPVTRRNVEEALREAGVSVDPPLETAKRETRVRLDLIEEPDTAEGEALQEGEEGEDVEQLLDDVLAAACDVLVEEREMPKRALAAAVGKATSVPSGTASKAITELEREGSLVTAGKGKVRVYRLPAPDPWVVPAPEDGAAPDPATAPHAAAPEPEPEP